MAHLQPLWRPAFTTSLVNAEGYWQVTIQKVRLYPCIAMQSHDLV